MLSARGVFGDGAEFPTCEVRSLLSQGGDIANIVASVAKISPRDSPSHSWSNSSCTPKHFRGGSPNYCSKRAKKHKFHLLVSDRRSRQSVVNNTPPPWCRRQQLPTTAPKLHKRQGREEIVVQETISSRTPEQEFPAG